MYIYKKAENIIIYLKIISKTIKIYFPFIYGMNYLQQEYMSKNVHDFHAKRFFCVMKRSGTKIIALFLLLVVG